MAVDEIPQNLDGKGLRIGIVIARFNEYAGRGEYEYCLGELKRLGVAEEDITVCHVPGALEIPFALQQMAQTGEYDALIAFGAVIRGETYHFELVANESASGITRVALDYNIPVANGILTTEDDEQCEDRPALRWRLRWRTLRLNSPPTAKRMTRRKKPKTKKKRQANKHDGKQQD